MLRLVNWVVLDDGSACASLLILNENDMDANSPAVLREEYASTSIPLSITRKVYE